MAVNYGAGSLRALSRTLGSFTLHESATHSPLRWQRRLMTTKASIASQSQLQSLDGVGTDNSSLLRRQPPSPTDVLATVYRFPTLEPTRFVTYNSDQLQLPLRRDLLHLAVVYEGDSTRLGTASTKDRGEIRGSRRKIRPQKGTGKARLGDKKSPMLRGGGVAHGPHPRDFSTGLPRKMYDRAWRTALSYRYKQGQLLLLEDEIDLDAIGQTSMEQLDHILRALQLGRGSGGSMFVISDNKPEQVAAFSELSSGCQMRTESDVDVKDLLTRNNLVIQKGVLDRILAAHSSDLFRSTPKAVYHD